MMLQRRRFLCVTFCPCHAAAAAGLSRRRQPLRRYHPFYRVASASHPDATRRRHHPTPSSHLLRELYFAAENRSTICLKIELNSHPRRNDRSCPFCPSAPSCLSAPQSRRMKLKTMLQRRRMTLMMRDENENGTDVAKKKNGNDTGAAKKRNGAPAPRRSSSAGCPSAAASAAAPESL